METSLKFHRPINAHGPPFQVPGAGRKVGGKKKKTKCYSPPLVGGVGEGNKFIFLIPSIERRGNDTPPPTPAHKGRGITLRGTTLQCCVRDFSLPLHKRDRRRT